MPAAKRHRPARVALALAGGGPEGAIYEIGALKALEDAVEGLVVDRLDTYVGVSAGAFIGSCLVNGITPTQMCRAIVSDLPGEHPFVPETFLSPAFREYLRGYLRVPSLLTKAVWELLSNPGERSLLEPLTRLARALPISVFDNEPIRDYLEHIFSLKGRTDDFRELPRRLFVVAADLASGQAVRFGQNGYDHVPISRAVQASTALPGLYPPVEIEGRNYVDGVLLKTVHASIALEEGCDLVICVNPLVPVDTSKAVEQGLMSTHHLVSRGLPTVLSQTFRTIIHSRMRAGFQSYAERYEGSELLLFEPSPHDYLMAFGNVFRFSSRRAVCEHAYASTMDDLRRRREQIEPVLRRHGLALRAEVLDAATPDLWTRVGFGNGRARTPAAVELEETLDRLEAMLERQLQTFDERELVGPPN